MNSLECQACGETWSGRLEHACSARAQIDALEAKLALAVAALEFYATLKDRDRKELGLRSEFGCGCCSGTIDDDGDLDYDVSVQGLTAREALASISKVEPKATISEANKGAE